MGADIFLFIFGIAVAMAGCALYISRTKTITEAAANDHESRVMRRQGLKTVAVVYVFWSCVTFVLAIVFAGTAGIVTAGIAVLIAILLLIRLATLR